MWSIALYRNQPVPIPVGESPDYMLHTPRRARWPWRPHTQADPFLFTHQDRLYLFYESQVADDFRRIEVATLDDAGLRKLGPILSEPFDLSYPVVFQHGDDIFLMPESQGAGGLRLYRFTNFPTEVAFVRTIAPGRFADPSPFCVDGRWYLFVTTPRGLELYHADDLIAGELAPHPCNPISNDPANRRCGGTPFRQDGHLLRPAQDSSDRYGGNLGLMRIDRISTTEYAESTYEPRIVAGEHDWNADGGHHVSVANIDGGQAVAVDGQAPDIWGHRVSMRAWMLLSGRRRR